MAKRRNREEVVNTQLAVAISRLGVMADAETIHVHGKHRPDVLFHLRGLRIVIEGKFDDVPNARSIVLGDARRRVRAGVAHIAAATVYPRKLRTVQTSELVEVLQDTRLQYHIISETSEGGDWFDGTPATIMEALRRAQESLTRDDIVERTASSLSAHLERVAMLWSGQTGSCDRLSKLLGMSDSSTDSTEIIADRRETAAKVAALVLANALIFQEQLASSDERVDTLRKLKKSSNVVNTASRHWHWIWENINYLPIFQLAERILDELPEAIGTSVAVNSLIDEAQEICSVQAALRHDLMGRIYHRLLYHAKYLGTYYTSVSAATLLLKLALDLKWSCDFGSARQLADFKVGDLACGTGTLLMAAAQAMTDQFIKTRAETDRNIQSKDLAVLHSTLMQNVIHGYDILSSAVHLTASTLALLAPEVAFRKMNLYVMPIGMDHGTARLGSLDFLCNDEVPTQFALDNTQLDSVRTGAASTGFENARVPKLDLCVMNPPFVSSRYGNRLFGSLPQDRPELQRALSVQAKRTSTSASAGLGALFVPLADMHTKRGGRIAFVLPIAVATGESWRKVRQFIAEKYHLEFVITSQDPSRTNYSENTELSEVLFIARKLKDGESRGSTHYVTLRRNPTTIHEALDLEDRLLMASNRIADKFGSTTIRSPSGALGEITKLPAPKTGQNWTSAIFAQSFLAQVHWHLEHRSSLKMPGSSDQHPILLCRLDALASVGYDVRDITDAFDVDKTASRWTPYPAFWNHSAKRVVQIRQEPNAFLIARTQPIPGRRLKDAAAVWGKAGRILLVSRLRTNTHKVIATGFDRKVLGNTWWALDDSSLSESQRKALLLWLNSTLGLLMYYGSRAITQGPWMQMKKPAWCSMPVLDVGRLDPQQCSNLSKAYDSVSELTLRPLSHIDRDPHRLKIDEALCEALSLPSLDSIRELLVREPGLTGQP